MFKLGIGDSLHSSTAFSTACLAVSTASSACTRLTTNSCPWTAVENLTDDNLEAVRQADELEGQLMDEMEDRETDVSPWGILNRLSPLLFAWVSNQLIMLNDWSGRIQGTEDWKPITSQRGCARSVLARSVSQGVLSFAIYKGCGMLNGPNRPQMHIRRDSQPSLRCGVDKYHCYPVVISIHYLMQ